MFGTTRCYVREYRRRDLSELMAISGAWPISMLLGSVMLVLCQRPRAEAVACGGKSVSATALRVMVPRHAMSESNGASRRRLCPSLGLASIFKKEKCTRIHAKPLKKRI